MRLPQYADSKNDQVTILNMLAAFYISAASRCSEANKKEELLSQGATFIRQADFIEMNHQLNLVCRGFNFLAQGKLENSTYYFNFAIENHNLAALLGKACSHFHKGFFKEALSLYAQALRLNPNLPANVRLGLGLCHYKIGNEALAKKAFLRVLELDPENADATVCLAVVEHASGNIDEYLALLERAYRYLPGHLNLCYNLSRHYFYQKDYSCSAKLAEFTVSRMSEVDKQIADLEKLRALCYMTEAQCYHAQENYDSAFRQYTQAAKIDSSNLVVQYGLGQMHLQRKDTVKATECFEAVLAASPNCPEALKVLGSLYAKQHKKEQAADKLKQAVKYNPRDWEAWIELAQLSEISKPELALEAYEKALCEIEDPPVELLNNVAVLRQRLGADGAEAAFQQASQGKHMRTISFNKARWYEDTGRLDEAKSIYEGLLGENKHWPDAHLRLSMVARAKGDYVEALNQCRLAVKYDKKPITALCQKGALEAELGDTVKAQETFNKVIMEHSHHDLYALVAMGNLYYESALKAPNSEKYSKQLRRALQYYLKVLSLDEHNAYAAAGTGIFLAEIGQTLQAGELFKQILDNAPQVVSCLINAGHMQFMNGRYESALKLYRKARARKVIDNSLIDTYIANTLYVAHRYEEAVAVLETMQSQPQVLFNIAFVLHEQALAVFKQEKRTLEQSQHAISQLNRSLPLYEEVISRKWEIKGQGEMREIAKRQLETSTQRSLEQLNYARMLHEQSSGYLEHDLEQHHRAVEQRALKAEQFAQLIAGEPKKRLKTEIE